MTTRFFGVLLGATPLLPLLLPPVAAQTQNAEAGLTTVAAANVGAFEWKMRAPVGAKFLLRYQIKTKIAQNVPSSEPNRGGISRRMRVENWTTTIFDAKYDIQSHDRWGNQTVRVTYDQIDVKTKSRVDGHALPSAAEAAAQQALDGFERAFRGASFQIKTSPRGDVIGIAGLEAVRSRLTRALTKIPGGNASAGEIVNTFLGDLRLKETFGRMGGQIPAFPVLPGETWEYRSDLRGVFPVAPRIEGRRTLSELSATTATIRDFATVQLNARNWQFTPQDSIKLSFKVWGTQDSTTWISRQTGMPTRATMYQRMNGTTSALVPGHKTSVVVPMWSASEFELRVIQR